MKKKAITYELELPELQLDEVQVMFWHTYYSNFQFVRYLNLLYRWSFIREDDLTVFTRSNNSDTQVRYPCFSYYDEEHRLLYYVVEQPSGGQLMMSSSGNKWDVLSQYDKIIFIVGCAMEKQCQQMYEDFQCAHSSAPEDEPSQVEWKALWREFADNGVSEVEYMNLSETGEFDATFMVNYSGLKESDIQKIKTLAESRMNLILSELALRIVERMCDCE